MLKSINQIVQRYRTDWGLFAKEILRVTLDREQEDCLYSIQNHRRVSIRSGNARGKDFVAAVASICFLTLYYPSKVIETAPTQRQAVGIMMSEIRSIYSRAAVPLGGEILTERIMFPNDPDPHYLMAFKAGEKEAEPWSGFHSPNLMVVVSEATGLDDVVFDAIEGILQANSKLVLCFNPFRLSGEAYRSITSPMYHRHRLNCLDAPNVRAKKNLIPGQVDYEWVRALVEDKGWAQKIDESEVQASENDFRWGDSWYRPTDLFRIKVLGEPPKESEDVLIPLSWIEMAQARWREDHELNGAKLKLGVDVAGQGRDFTVFCRRYDAIVSQFDKYANQDHMVTVGRIGEALKEKDSVALIDTIGEGAGVYSRCKELKHNAKSAKFSESGKGLKDYSKQRTFANMRAYCVSGETLILMEIEGKRIIKQIEDVAPSPGTWRLDYANILTHTGNWTTPLWAVRKYSKKMIQIIQSHSGVLEITPEHLIKVNGEYKKAGELEIGEKIDSQSIGEYLTINENPSFTKEFAWALGFWFADGYSKILKKGYYYWGVHNINRDYLFRCIEGFRCFGVPMKIASYKSQGIGRKQLYQIVPACIEQGQRKMLAYWFRNNFYRNGHKYLPEWIFNEPDDFIDAFVEGLWVGDGDKPHRKQRGSLRIVVENSQIANGLKILCDRMSWLYGVYPAGKSEKAFTVLISKTKMQIIPAFPRKAQGNVKQYIRNKSQRPDRITHIRNIEKDCYDIVANGEFVANSFNVHNCYWAIRDALDPRYDFQLALPPDDELAQELHETKWTLRSNGDIQIEDKDEIKERLKRSPDKADSLALTFYPVKPLQIFI